MRNYIFEKLKVSQSFLSNSVTSLIITSACLFLVEQSQLFFKSSMNVNIFGPFFFFLQFFQTFLLRQCRGGGNSKQRYLTRVLGGGVVPPQVQTGQEGGQGEVGRGGPSYQEG